MSIQKQPPEVFYEKRCSLNFRRIQGNHLFQSLFFSKVAGLRSATLLKRRLWHRCFPVNFVKFLRTLFLQNTSRRLLLTICYAISFIRIGAVPLNKIKYLKTKPIFCSKSKVIYQRKLDVSRKIKKSYLVFQFHFKIQSGLKVDDVK